MYTGLLHSHKLFVLLFLLHYIFKFVLLFTDRKDALERYSKTMRIPEILLSVGFLITGVWMMLTGTAFTNLIVIKLIFVFSSIPLAVIGFKRGNKVIAFVAVTLIFLSYGLAEMNKKTKTGSSIDTSSISDPVAVGKLIYSNSCVSCHGEIGNGGISGAKDLSLTTLTTEEQKAVILHGKNAMPKYKNILSEEQVGAVVQYIATLKQ